MKGQRAHGNNQITRRPYLPPSIIAGRSRQTMAWGNGRTWDAASAEAFALRTSVKDRGTGGGGRFGVFLAMMRNGDSLPRPLRSLSPRHSQPPPRSQALPGNAYLRSSTAIRQHSTHCNLYGNFPERPTEAFPGRQPASAVAGATLECGDGSVGVYDDLNSGLCCWFRRFPECCFRDPIRFPAQYVPGETSVMSIHLSSSVAE